MQITDHKGSTLNNDLEITRKDASESSGAGKIYEIAYNFTHNGYAILEEIQFQDGELKDGVNGITDESLIAIVLDRLRGFNEGRFRCRENSLAITHLEEGLMWLQKRAVRRQNEGIEGTHKLTPEESR